MEFCNDSGHALDLFFFEKNSWYCLCSKKMQLSFLKKFDNFIFAKFIYKISNIYVLKQMQYKNILYK